MENMAQPQSMNHENRGLFLGYKFLPESRKINVFVFGKSHPYNKLRKQLSHHLEYLIKTSFNGIELIDYEVIDKESTLKKLLLHRGLIIETESILCSVKPLHVYDGETVAEAIAAHIDTELPTALKDRITENENKNKELVEHNMVPLIPTDMYSHMSFSHPEIKANPDKDITIYLNYNPLQEQPIQEIENPTSSTIVILDTTYNDEEWDSLFLYQNIDDLIKKGYTISGRVTEVESQPTPANCAQVDDIFNGMMSHIGNLKIKDIEVKLKNMKG